MVKKVLNERLVRTQIYESEMKCPLCGRMDFIRYGRTARDTLCWQCKHCHAVHSFCSTGMMMANTKLDRDKWMVYAECFVDHLTSSEV